jgi:hypothetical protein
MAAVQSYAYYAALLDMSGSAARPCVSDWCVCVWWDVCMYVCGGMCVMGGYVWWDGCVCDVCVVCDGCVWWSRTKDGSTTSL